MPEEYEMDGRRPRKSVRKEATKNDEEAASSSGGDVRTLANLGKKQSLKVSIHDPLEIQRLRNISERLGLYPWWYDQRCSYTCTDN